MRQNNKILRNPKNERTRHVVRSLILETNWTDNLIQSSGVWSTGSSERFLDHTTICWSAIHCPDSPYLRSKMWTGCHICTYINIIIIYNVICLLAICACNIKCCYYLFLAHRLIREISIQDVSEYLQLHTPNMTKHDNCISANNLSTMWWPYYAVLLLLFGSHF